jgi:hypothetical protein
VVLCVGVVVGVVELQGKQASSQCTSPCSTPAFPSRSRFAVLLSTASSR